MQQLGRLLAASVMNRSIHLLARLLLQRRLQYWEGSASEIRPAGHGGRQDVGMYPCALELLERRGRATTTNEAEEEARAHASAQ